jgi:protein arginine kinase activator
MYSKKKCMKCGQPATHKFTKIEKGQIYDIFLCAEHAAEMSPYQKPKIPLSDILEGLFKQEAKQKGGPAAPTNLRCQSCGLPFEAYKKNLLLGCSDCYTYFREYLIPDLRRFHGDTRHFGRKPGGGQARPSQRDLFMAQLEGESAGPVAKEETTAAQAEPGIDFTELIDDLTQEMHEAIEEEDYARAARCRDQIRELKAKMKSAPSGE